MNIKITKSIQGGKVKAIASKSQAHRLLICAALETPRERGVKCESFISCTESSEDIDATIRCLIGLGAEIKSTNEGFHITPINRSLISQTKTYTLDCGESGATLRFMLPVCAALGASVEIYMKGRLPSRPLTDLYNVMTSHGCLISPQGVSPLTCTGQLSSGKYTLSGNISSQYISGLLLALPLLKDESKIQVTGTLESRPYVDMTLEALRLFGIKINENETNTFIISGTQNYTAPKEIKVGGDWSNAAFWLSAGAIGKSSITCTGLDLKSQQGDKKVCELLARFGAKVEYEKTAVTVTPETLCGIEIDAKNIPDLVPILAAVASVAKGKTIIYNAERLRIKESDRLKTVTQMLSKLGADIKETKDGLIITGNATLTGGVVESYGDHRIAMTAAVISAVCTTPVEIIGADAVRKSYPTFFEDFKVLGADWDEF